MNLIERANLSINYLTTNPQPSSKYIPYFGGKVPQTHPPYFERCPWDLGDSTGRFLEALITVREITNNPQNQFVDEKLIDNLFSYIGEDGLCRNQKLPWSPHGGMDIWNQRGIVLALALLYKKTGETRCRDACGRVLDELWKLVIRDGETYAFKMLWADGQWSDAYEAGLSFMPVEMLMAYYEASQDERALERAGKLVNTMLKSKVRMFDDDGKFFYPKIFTADGRIVDESAQVSEAYQITGAHVHSRAAAAWGMMQYSLAIGDKDLFEHGKRIHDWIISQGTDFGWIPENVKTHGRESCEMCNLMDAFKFNLLLAKKGHAEYWDAIDKAARNHLDVSQFRITDEVRQLMDKKIINDPLDDSRSYKNALQRLEGGFAGPMLPNDMFTFYPKSRDSVPRNERLIDISGCCSPSGARSLGLVYANIITNDGKHPVINLLFDCENSEIRMKSFLPRQGEVSIVMKKDCCLLSVRMPRFVSNASVRCSKNKEEIKTPAWDSAGVAFNDLKKDDEINIKFPIAARKQTITIAERQYALSWKGNYIEEFLGQEEPLLPVYKLR